jgi:SHS2 domain-containing protein
MPYSYIEHLADIGIRAKGATVEEAFVSGAEAVLNIMFDLSTIDITENITFGIDGADLQLLFVEVLNETLSIQDIHGLAFKRLTTGEIKELNDGFRFIGTAYGEPLDLEKHAVKTEVKAATYSGLSYKKGSEGEHVFECILDV